tara:strand:- start:725 stop:1516 length:792 start_codon:yes stop_codon:yes gene_type:complete
MRRSRRVRKVVKITVPTEKTINSSRISRGKISNHSVKRVNNVPTIPREDRKYISNNTKPKYKYGKVDKIWNGETVYLIGGGPSLKNFKWNSLQGKKTIAINKAITVYPNADAVYWTDGRVYTWFEKEINEFKGLKYTIRARNYSSDITILKKGKKYGLELTKDTLSHGNNSGYAAINLAIHLGAKRIVLLGYDMGNNGTSTHFHDGYPVNPTSAKIYKDQFLPGFTILRDELKGKGIQIFNACPTSNLKVFPIITIEEALGFR